MLIIIDDPKDKPTKEESDLFWKGFSECIKRRNAKLIKDAFKEKCPIITKAFKDGKRKKC